MDKRSYYQDTDVARDYDRIRFGSRSGQLTHAVEVRALQSVLSKNQKILEIACGTGRLLKTFLEGGWDIHGIDQSKAMLEAGGLLNHPHISVGDFLELPYPARSFDAVYFFRVSNHYGDLRPVFKECRRVLKTDGHLLFDHFNWSPLKWDLRRWGGKNFTSSQATVRGWLAESGFPAAEAKPLFLISPYLLAQAPYFVAQAASALSPHLPASWHAVELWHAR